MRERTLPARIPYLDGLRAYSIMLVLFNHSNGQRHWLGSHPWLASVFADGELGVRIFFVISGFLITTLLLQEIERSGSISIRGFYERRIARIFPAYFLYIGLVGLLGLFHFISIPRYSYVAAMSFTYNGIAFLTHFFHHVVTGSMDDSLVFAHFWSLSVEEQFYLLWPTCLVLVGLLWSRRLAIMGILVLPLLRLLAAHYVQHPGARQAFVSGCMQDLILIGVLAAFSARAGWVETCRTLPFRALLPWLSVAVLFGLCPWLASLQKLELTALVVPSAQGLAVAVLIFWLLSGSGGWLRNFLEFRPVITLGLVSYSLYIWQQPFTLSPRFAWLPFPTDVLTPVAISFLCYYAWELPMRNRIRTSFRQAPAAHS